MIEQQASIQQSYNVHFPYHIEVISRFPGQHLASNAISSKMVTGGSAIKQFARLLQDHGKDKTMVDDSEKQENKRKCSFIGWPNWNHRRAIQESLRLENWRQNRKASASI